MEQNQDSSLFGINVDQAGRAHLADAAKWGRFLAIFGFIICGIVVLIGIFFGSFFSLLTSQYSSNPYSELPGGSGMGAAMGTSMAILYVLIALIYFFPCLYLFKFATKMKTALATNDQAVLNASFQNLKASLRFIGILTIVMICFWILALIVGVLGVATGSRL